MNNILEITKDQALTGLGITEDELKAIHTAARQVMEDIVWDLADCYPDKTVPRYDLIQCVCDCSRLEEQIKSNRGRRNSPSDNKVDALVRKLRYAGVDLLYGVVGIELTDNEVYCI